MKRRDLPGRRVGRGKVWVFLSIVTLSGLTGCLRSGGSSSEPLFRFYPDPSPKTHRLYDRLARASVEILVDDHLSGSGALVDPDGWVITAEHVLGGPGRRVEVLSPTLGRLSAEVKAVDCGHDLALLRIDAANRPYPYLETAATEPEVGRSAWLFGAPLFRHQIMTPGMVASSGSAFEWLGTTDRYLETRYFSASTPKGMSGGGWVDDRGQLIGLQSGMMTNGASMLGLAFATRLEPIHRLLDSRQSAVTPTMRLPIEEYWEQEPAYMVNFPAGQMGVVARSPVAGGPAARARVRDMQLIVAVDRQPVRYRDEVLRWVRSRQVGDVVSLTILAPSGGRQTVEVVLETLEQPWLDHFARTQRSSN